MSDRKRDASNDGTEQSGIEGKKQKTNGPDASSGRPGFPDLWMACALLAARRSKDTSTKVGCVLVEEQSHRVIGVGWNGFINDPEADSYFSWSKSNRTSTDIADKNQASRSATGGIQDGNKDDFVIHAESNAILFSDFPLLREAAAAQKLTCYVTMWPCIECAKKLFQVGVTKVVYLGDDEQYTGAKFLQDLQVNCEQVELKSLQPIFQHDLHINNEGQLALNNCLGPFREALNDILLNQNDAQDDPGDGTEAPKTVAMAYLIKCGLKQKRMNKGFSAAEPGVENPAAPALGGPIGWTSFFMGLASLAARLCGSFPNEIISDADLSDHVGCVLVDKQRRVLSISNRGVPYEQVLPEDPSRIVCACINGVLLSNSRIGLDQATCYVTRYPCDQCARFLIQAGVSCVYHLDCQPERQPDPKSSMLFSFAGVSVRGVTPKVIEKDSPEKEKRLSSMLQDDDKSPISKSPARRNLNG